MVVVHNISVGNFFSVVKKSSNEIEGVIALKLYERVYEQHYVAQIPYFICPNCDNRTNWQLIMVKEKAKLMQVMTIPSFKEPEHFIVCSNCQSGKRITKEELNRFFM